MTFFFFSSSGEFPKTQWGGLVSLAMLTKQPQSLLLDSPCISTVIKKQYKTQNTTQNCLNIISKLTCGSFINYFVFIKLICCSEVHFFLYTASGGQSTFLNKSCRPTLYK